MRGFTKKAITVMVLASTFAQSAGVFAKVPSEIAGTRFEEPIQVLSALKIMIGDDNGKFRPDDTIIRSEVAKMAIHALGLEGAADASKGTSKFPDVAVEHWANGYINLATSKGIIIGDENGNFRPDDTITYAEAMTIMVRTLGYEPVAKEKGGFPNGYILTASENGLGKNVQGSTNSPITRGNVAFLTMNSLETKLMEQTNFGAVPEYSVVDKTLLTDRLGVTKHQGQVVAIPNSGISGESNILQGRVQIGEKVYETAYSMNNLLGYNVTYYVKDEGKSTEEIILAMPTSGQNKTLIVSGDLFENITDKDGKKFIEYFESKSSSKTKTAELSDKVKLVYNGKYAEFSNDLLNIKDKSASVELLDTDKDGVYDIVFVTVYRNMVVDTVSSTGKISDKYEEGVLQLNEDVDFRIEKGFEEIKVSDLKEYDVLSIAQSLDKKLYTVIVTNEKVEGKVTGNDEDGVIIGDKHYKVASNYKKEIEIGMEGIFYLDVFGKIAAVDTATNLSSNYAYLMRAYSTDDDVVKFKFFSKEGKEEIAEASDKVRLNGKSAKKATEVLKELKGKESEVKSQLVTFTKNADGKVSEINIAKDNTGTGAYDSSNFTLNYSLNDAVFNERESKLGNIRVDADTVIFNIPEGSTDAKDFTIASIEMFEDEESYDVLVYDRTEDYTAKAIVVTDANFKTNADSPIAVVTSLAEGINKDDEVTDILKVLVNGKEETLYADGEGVFKKGDEDLEEGDIIQYKKNSDGEVVSVRVLMNIDNKGTEKNEKPAENLEIVYGKVTKKFSSSINVTVNDKEARNFRLSDSVVVYSIDTTVSKNRVTVAEINDIQSFEEEEGNRVFVKLYKGVVEEIVIIK